MMERTVALMLLRLHTLTRWLSLVVAWLARRFYLLAHFLTAREWLALVILTVSLLLPVVAALLIL